LHDGSKRPAFVVVVVVVVVVTLRGWGSGRGY